MGNKSTNAVDDGSGIQGASNALEPVPRLVYLVLAVGDFGADHGYGGHEGG